VGSEGEGREMIESNAAGGEMEFKWEREMKGMCMTDV
jgi:hypothetical protein